MNEIRAAQEELTQGVQRGRPVVLRSRARRAPDASQGGADAGAAQGDGAPSKPADDVVEADYEIVDETRSRAVGSSAESQAAN